MGDFVRVKRWFDAEGKPALGDVANHAPATSLHRPWNDVGVQEVLDTALAWAVINRHFDVADFLLEHGANINTDWNSHEPASILHLLVFLPNPYESMQFLIDRGIDMTIKDYRWNSTAAGLGVPRPERPQDGPVARGRGTAAGPATAVTVTS